MDLLHPFPHYTTTQHLRQRMQQRGRTQADFDLIVCYGTEVRRDLYMLTSQDIDELTYENRRLARAADRLRGWAAVVCEGNGITLYPLSGDAGRRAIRGQRTRRKRTISDTRDCGTRP